MDRTAQPKTIEPRQTRALKTRAALLDAVETLVASEGSASVTTTRLAVMTGVSVGTIYRYFADREALLLAAYDATVTRIVEQCASALEGLDQATPVDLAATRLLGIYLDAAETIPSHAGLLAAMRSIRPIEADQSGNNEASIVGDILAPFLGKFMPGGAPDTARLHFMNVLIGTMVDLYLVTPDRAERRSLRSEIDAHMLLALRRLTAAG